MLTMLRRISISALAFVLVTLAACGGGELEEPLSELAKLEQAHGGPDKLRTFFETHTEAEIAAELAAFGIGYEVHDAALAQTQSGEESPQARIRAITDCNKFFPTVDRLKWHKFNGEYYYIDGSGRPHRAYADLPPIKAEARQNTCQTSIGQWGDAENPSNDYDGGHLIGSQLGGWGGRANIVPQDANFNRGNWAQLENKMATCGVLAVAAMRYSINVEYSNSTALVPTAFLMEITRQSNGAKIVLRFSNVDGGGTGGTAERQRGVDFLTANGCV
jgi:hypothetical protein